MACVVFSLLLSGAVLAQPADDQRLDDVFLLIQSELSHLDQPDRRIDVKLAGVTPADALRRIAKAAGISIDVEGKLARAPRLTAAFKATSVQKVLEWFAVENDVVYRAVDGTTLLVIPRPAVARSGE